MRPKTLKAVTAWEAMAAALLLLTSNACISESSPGQKLDEVGGGAGGAAAAGSAATSIGGMDAGGSGFGTAGLAGFAGSGGAVQTDGGATAGGSSGGSTLGGSSGSGSGGAGATGGGLTPRFSFTPGWSGVTKVSVVGGFGKADDWQAPLLVLTNDGHGTFSGSIKLPPGKYLYGFQLGGRGKIPDPLVAEIEFCPPASSPAVPNIACSVLHVPQLAPDPVRHIRGQLQADGSAVAGWDVSMERNDPGFHHGFIGRTTAGADGKFDLPIASGRYHLAVSRAFNATENQVGIPLAMSADSSLFVVTADVTLPPTEVSFHDNALLAPADSTLRALPLTLHFPITQGAVAMQATVFGARGPGGPVWWFSPLATQTSVVFDGTFNGAHAGAPQAVSGEMYWWGVAAKSAPDAAGVEWLRQSMVFPLNVK